MKRLMIIEIDNYIYTLRDEENKIHILNLEFFGIDEKLEPGDVIYISKKLLNTDNEEYLDFYTFEKLKSQYDQNNYDEKMEDLIKVEKKRKNYYLKRIYG